MIIKNNTPQLITIILVSIAILLSIFLSSIAFTLFDEKIAEELVKYTGQTKEIKTEWIGYWGNLFGAIIQGIITALGIIFTVYIYLDDKKEKQKDKLKAENEKFKNEYVILRFAFDKMILLTSQYNDLKTFYESNMFEKLEELSKTVKDGEIITIISIMQEKGISYKRLWEQSNGPESPYYDLDGNIRKNMIKLKELLTNKRDKLKDKYHDITNVDLSEETIWDEDSLKVLFLSAKMHSTSSFEASAEIIVSKQEEKK